MGCACYQCGRRFAHLTVLVDHLIRDHGIAGGFR